jgi:hypothetical protein
MPRNPPAKNVARPVEDAEAWAIQAVANDWNRLARKCAVGRKSAKASKIGQPFKIPSRLRSIAIADLPAGSRLRRTLALMNIRNLEDVHGRQPAEFLRYLHFGARSLEELRALIARAATGEFTRTEE